MADKRFPWSRASHLDRCYELYQRNAVWTPENDPADLECLVCKQPIQADEPTYLPSKGVNTHTNKWAGHVDCVDETVGKHTTAAKKEAKAVEAKKQEQKGVLPASSVAKAVKAQKLTHPTLDDALALALKQARQKLDSSKYSDGYSDGYRAGFLAALAKLTEDPSEDVELSH